jgi:hypothetical protein
MHHARDVSGVRRKTDALKFRLPLHRIMVSRPHQSMRIFREADMATGQKAASDAAKILRDPTSTKSEK